MKHETPFEIPAGAPLPSVLFVDDEVRILDGLRRALRSRRGSFEPRFAAGGEAALAELEREPADVVVSDMRMPEIDGVALLTRVRERWPQSLRVILSGQSDSEAGVEASRVAHQYLNKPSDHAVVADTIERARKLHALIPDPRLRARAGGLTALAARPCSRAALDRILADGSANAAAAVPVIATDVALSAKVLHLTGTCFFVRPHPFVELETAVACLGIDALRTLAASHLFASAPSAAGDDWLEAHHARAVREARATREGVTDTPRMGLPFLRGLFSDLGTLVMASGAGDEREPWPGGDLDPATSRRLGAYLLGLWGVSWPLVSAVAVGTPRPVPAARDSGSLAA